MVQRWSLLLSLSLVSILPKEKRKLDFSIYQSYVDSNPHPGIDRSQYPTLTDFRRKLRNNLSWEDLFASLSI